MAWPVLPHGFLGTAAVTGDEDTYQVERSLRFNSSDSANLTWTPNQAGNRTTWTQSFWVKRTKFGTEQHLFEPGLGVNYQVFFSTTDALWWYENGSYQVKTNQVFRDPSSWYHLVMVWDSSNATSADRLRIYVNGERVTSFATAPSVTLNQNSGWNSASTVHYFGRINSSSLYYFDGYLAEVNVVDGQALTPASFGETDAVTGRWKAKAFSGSYGLNGFYLNFSDNSNTTAATLGKDSAPIDGNHTAANNYTPTNFSVTAGVGNDSFVDSPTNYGALTHTFSDDTYQISRSLRFNSADSAYLNRTAVTPTSQNKWTLSFWAKQSKLGINGNILSSGSDNTQIYFTSGDAFSFAASGTATFVTTQLFRDASVWNHFVLAVDSGAAGTAKARLYLNGSEITTFSTDNRSTFSSSQINQNTIVQNIGRYGFGASNYFDGYLAEVYFIDGQQLDPTSFGQRNASTYTWKPKAYSGTYGNNGFYLNFSDNSGTTSTTLGKDQAGSNNWTPNNFVVATGTGNDSLVDTPTYYGTDAGAGGEARGDYCTLDPNFKVAAITLTNGNLDYSQTASAGIVLGTIQVSSGKWYWEMHQGSGRGLPGIAEVTTPTSSTYVGATAKSYSYYSFNGNKYNNGANSAYGATFTSGDIIGIALNLDAGTLEFFKNNVSQGVAFTGISGTFTPAIGDGTVSAAIFNFGQRPFTYTAPSGFKALRDYNRQLVPTGGVIRGNYATLNDLAPSKPTLLNGALQTNAGNLGCINTFGMTTGKWFCEMDVVTVGAESSVGVSKGGTMSTFVGASADSWGYYSSGPKYNNGSGVTYGASFTSGDTIGCAFDADLGLLSFYKNGVYQGVAFSGLTSGPYFFSTSGRTSTAANNVYINFGQRPWVYGPPAGFRPVCSTSIPQPTIQKASSYMDVVRYTGTGATQTIGGLGFSPDLVWVKDRSITNSHNLFDSVRPGFRLRSDSTAAEAATTVTLGSSGFTLGTETESNNNTSLFVGWAWDEAQIAGLDIINYVGDGVAGRTVAHNLGVAPKFIIVKNRVTAGFDLVVYHANMNASPQTGYISLNATLAFTTLSTVWNNTAPTSSVFTLGTNIAVNKSGENHIAYVFAEVEGFSKFGSFAGNNSTDGPFIWCGFRPKYVLVKKSSATGPWMIFDSVRDTFNVSTTELRPNETTAEPIATRGSLDILSNGFKIRSTSATSLGELGDFVFAAFAESPFKYARAR